MLRRQHYFLPLLTLMLCVFLTYVWPHKVWWWGALFFLISGAFFLLGVIGSFLRFDRLLHRNAYDELIALTEPLWLNAKNPNLKRIAGLYFAAAKLSKGGAANLDAAEEVLKALNGEGLSPRFRNRYRIVSAQAALYRDRYNEALNQLKGSTLQPLGVYYLTRLFYYFSLAFTMTRQEAERSFNYAAKAYEFAPQEPLFQAQFGLVSHLRDGGDTGLVLIRAALAALPPERHPWERALYERYLTQKKI